MLFGLLFLFALQVSSSDVISSTEKTFSKILENKLPVFVKFYAPWCGHCKSLAPIWEKAAASLKGLANVVKVDCTVDQNLCQRYGVQGYPTLKLFKNKGKQVKDYQQQRDLNSIVRFATSEIDDKSVKIKSEEDLNKFLDKEPTKPHVILFSEKSSTAPLYKALSSVFEGSLVFGFVTSKVASVLEKYGPIEKFPHILVVTENGVTMHTGEIAYGPLKSFLSEFGTPDASQSSESKSESKPEPKPAPVKPDTPLASWKDINLETLDEACKNTLCVLAFADYDAESKTAVPEQKAILDQTLLKFHKGGKLTFFVGSTNDTNLKEKFKFTEPTLLIYNAKKQKVAKASAFDINSIHILLERALGGDFSYTPL